MIAQEPVTRQYRMLCQRCDHTWQGTYVIVTLHDDAGDHELFYRNGAPSIGPAATLCPYCCGLRVRILPGQAPGSAEAPMAPLGEFAEVDHG